MTPVRLGINVDHVATLRNVRSTNYPDPVSAARLAATGGADSIVIHLREDRRHIRDADLRRMLSEQPLPVNLEMAPTAEMATIACKGRPHYVCLVPERREELTTEGGLNVAEQIQELRSVCLKLAGSGIEVALFIDADLRQVEAAVACGVPHVEIHTGRFADAKGQRSATQELERIAGAARQARQAGLEVHAGHGLHLENVRAVAAIPEIVELNIGHSVIAHALEVGLREAVTQLRSAILGARCAT